MRRLLIIAATVLLACQYFGCKKKQEDPKPEDYFCYNAAEVQDTSQIKQSLIGQWKMTASLGSYYRSFHLVQPKDTAVYLTVYPDSTFEFYQGGQPIVRKPYHLYLNQSSASSNLGYGGNLWFCDPSTLIMSGAMYDGPTIRYEHIK